MHTIIKNSHTLAFLCLLLSNNFLFAAESQADKEYEYKIAVRDQLRVFVWRNNDLTVDLPVRPDGKISIPLVGDLKAQNKTPSTLAAEIETKLSRYIKSPSVTVIVLGFGVGVEQQVRIIGEVKTAQSIQYVNGMTLLDAMILVKGLTESAAGNRAILARKNGEGISETQLRIEDLLQDGDLSANVRLAPGDIVIVPLAWF